MKLGPRYKICRRLGNGTFEQCQTQRYALSESRRGTPTQKHRRTQSEYGKQLLEKQRVRFAYGIPERQFQRYVKEAMEKRGTDSVLSLLERLETRLDNVVFRAGLAPTRRSARQMVSHGHITVNGRKVTIPSYRLPIGTAFAVRKESQSRALFTAEPEKEVKNTPPAWMQFDVKNLEGSLTAQPDLQSVKLPGDLGVILEFYSR